MIRSVVAVLAGLVTLSATMFAVEAVANPLLMWMFSLPNEFAINRHAGAVILSFGYQVVCIICAGYVTAWLARRSGVRHAVIMGAIQAALVIPAWLEFRERAPTANWLIGMALIVPAAWAGGRIQARKKDQEKGSASALNSGIHGHPV